MIRNFSFLCWVDVFTAVFLCVPTSSQILQTFMMFIDTNPDFAVFGFVYTMPASPWRFAISSLFLPLTRCRNFVRKNFEHHVLIVFFWHILRASAHATSLLRGIVSGVRKRCWGTAAWGKHDMAGLISHILAFSMLKTCHRPTQSQPSH